MSSFFGLSAEWSNLALAAAGVFISIIVYRGDKRRETGAAAAECRHRVADMHRVATTPEIIENVLS